MFYNKIFLILFLIFSCCQKKVLAQYTSNKTITSFKKYNEKNGYKVFSSSSLEFDNLGWLWVSGFNLELVDEEINSRTSIIQRFDGNRFYTVKTPFFANEKPIDIKLIKRQDGHFYLIFRFKSNQLLYILNPETLVFKEIKLPNSKQYDHIDLFNFKNYSLVFLRKDKKTEIFKLNNDLQLSLFTNKPIFSKENKSISHFKYFIPFSNHFLISEERTGVYIYKENGDFIKKVSFEDLGIKNKQENRFLTVDNWFIKENKVLVLFKEKNEVYSYNEDKNQWIIEKESIKKKNRFENNWFYTDTKGNTIENFTDIENFGFYFNNELNKETIDLLNKNYANVSSRDFSKELFFTGKGEFYQYNFEKPIVSTFLENESIRNLLQINKEEILVACEGKGLYKINLKTKDVERLQVVFKDEKYISVNGRAIFEDKNYYWTNNGKGIVWIDKKTKIIEEEVYYPPSTLIEDQNFIYYGTLKYKLLKFNKKTKKSIEITETTNFDVQGILKIENSFYLACAEGLLVYKNGKKQLYKATEKGNDNFFLSITNHPKHGILLGSHSGKLFQFNPQENSFTLLYEDELNASIATILFDDSQQIWLNTFNGIVSLDEKYHQISRFTTNDGLSFYEANRYSALKTNDGYFLVGTLQGLNYFHPKEITKKKINANLKLTSTSCFDKRIKKEVQETSPKTLESIKSISLSPESKNLQLQFSLFGIYNTEKIKYRYKLNSDSWIDLGNIPEVRLLNLSTGNYKLQIEAVDSINNTIGNPIFLSIAIDEFFYKSAWFYTLLFLVVMSLGVWYFFEQRKKYQLKEQFASQIINTQENERSRVAKELHDSIGQRLLILKKKISLKESFDNEELKMIDDTIAEVRNISHNLHPFQFEKIGLVTSLENILDEFQKSSEVFYSYKIDNIDGILSKEKELFIFRMVQECIVNVEKHANATACSLYVKNKKDRIEFLLKDNGKGFDIDNQVYKNGIGLKNLQERASYLNAFFDIKALKNKGTEIKIKIRK